MSVSYKKCLSGFSLIEILVAIIIFGIVLLPFLSFVSHQIARERKNKELRRAVGLAHSKMEEVLLLPDIRDCEDIIDDKFLIKVDVLDGDKSGEPENLEPSEIHISVYDLKTKRKYLELYSLK
ncbi:hypothetical protein BXT86_01290 [candidate division WOR-3 bacterium 4484_100]|uniref:Type II secretion system protein GspI C-terminal domain-containing protein n=1 Tax=candidate division WOR-3 bacterium 4484_100 TaxID=1936077 RepID=A0A1V4QGD3_UNCW3|nr:MAG: hypothetical protein BXT86_01290 [candidate division WOR-3 bacterium 4484_100]